MFDRGRAVLALVGIALAGAPAPGAAQIIDTVIVLKHHIFEREDRAPALLAGVANALHFTTRESTIRRVLLLDRGDPYDSARAAESERALRSLGVFRRVRVDTTWAPGTDGRDRLALLVETADGWSTKPDFEYRSSNGDVAWSVNLVEENLLGTATHLAVGYSVTPDRHATLVQYSSPSFLFRRSVLDLSFDDLSDGHRGAWRFGVPFYETSARRSLLLGGGAAVRRVLIYRDGVLDTALSSRALIESLAGGLALHATTTGYTRLWARALWRREDYGAEGAVLPRSRFGAVGLGLELAAVRFEVRENVNTFARREDLDVSDRMVAGAWALPRAFGYPAGRAGAGLALGGQIAATWPWGLAVLRARADAIFAGDGVDSSRAVASLTLLGTSRLHAAVLHVEGGSLRRPAPGSEFDLWQSRSGPRLFGAHAFTGTRTFWLMLEDRMLLARDVAGLFGIGVAPFLDWGGAWYGDESARTGSDAGLALRLGPTRAAVGDVIEIAVGRRWGAGLAKGSWALAIGTSMHVLGPERR